MDSDPLGEIRLGHLFQAAGLEPKDVGVIRHTLNPGGLVTRADAVGPNLLPYVREQGERASNQLKGAGIWLNFLATTGLRARFVTAFENCGEETAERTDLYRYFDLKPSTAFSALTDRLVIDWTGAAVNFAQRGELAISMPVVEIADPQTVPFPGFDSIIVGFNELQAIVEDARYIEWRAALSSMKGIYLIADTKSGQLYVGKADGTERFLSRWGAYARDGHGGNVALRQLDRIDLAHRQHFQFSILQVFSPTAPASQVDAAEVHFKKVLLTRQFGLNRN